MDIRDLTAYVNPLLADQESYITFLEAHNIDRMLCQLDTLPTKIIPYLEPLLDHPLLTLGGYKIIQQAINRTYSQILDQWRLGTTAIGYEQNNSLIRIKPGQKFTISLTEEGDGSQQWESPIINGPIQLTFSNHYLSATGRGLGYYRCEFSTQTVGLATIQLSYLGLGMARKSQKPFMLDIFIEEEQFPQLKLDLERS